MNSIRGEDNHTRMKKMATDKLPLELLVVIFEQLSSFRDLNIVGLVHKRWHCARALTAQWPCMLRNRNWLAQTPRQRMEWVLKTKQLSRGEGIRAQRWLMTAIGGCGRTDLYYLLVKAAMKQNIKLLRRIDKLADVRRLCRLALGLEHLYLEGAAKEWMQNRLHQQQSK